MKSAGSTFSSRIVHRTHPHAAAFITRSTVFRVHQLSAISDPSEYNHRRQYRAVQVQRQPAGACLSDHPDGCVICLAYAITQVEPMVRVLMKKRFAEMGIDKYLAPAN